MQQPLFSVPARNAAASQLPVWQLSLLGLLLMARPGMAQTPTVTASVPARNALVAPTTSTLSLTFSQALAATTTSNIKTYSAQAEGRKAGNMVTTNATVVFTPQTAFKPGERISVSVPATVQSTGGTAVAPYVYQFTTAAGGSGRGNFQAPTSASPVVGNAYSLAFGDVDRDGDLDLVVTNIGSVNASVSVQLNNGAGVFTALPAVVVPPYPTNVALGDLDGDGDLDFLCSVAANAAVTARFNDGTGTFSPPASNPNMTVGFSPYQVVIGDVDADGDLDFVVANQASNSFSVRLNNSSGVFSTPATGAEVAVGISPTSAALGDLDGDGDLDVVTANLGTYNGTTYPGTTVSVRLNNGSGVFSAPAANAELTVGTGPTNVTLGDIDGDGDLDLLVANRVSNNVSVRFNNGSAVFGGGSEFNVGTTPNSVVLADVDADGDLDALTANQGSNNVSVRLNNGSGVFAAPTTGAEISVGTTPAHIALADMDGDGDLDFAASNNGNNSVSLRLNAAGVLASKAARLAPTFAMWPNPAQGTVRVQVPVGTPSVSLLDGLGRVVRTVSVATRGSEVIVPLTGLAAGVYVVRVGAAAQSLVVE